MPLGEGRVLIEPAVIARLVQLAAIVPGERALVVAAGTGYGAALLAACGARVTALEESASLRDIARGVLAELAPSVRLVAGPLAAGWPPGAPYDVILIEGAVREIPARDRRTVAPADRAAGRDLRRGGRPRPGGAGRGHRRRPAHAADVRLRHPADPQPAAGRRASCSERRGVIDSWRQAARCGTEVFPRGRGADMVLRYGWVLGLGSVLVAAPAFGQTPTAKPAPAKPITTGAADGQERDRRAGAATRCAAHAGRGAGGHLREPARVAGRACQAAGDRRERASGAGRLAADRRDGGNRRVWRRVQPPVFRCFGRLPERADRPADRHRAGNTHPAPVYRRQDAGQRQPRQEPGHGGARQPDRAGADQLHQRDQRLCRRHRGAAVAGTQHQQRAGAGQAASGHQ